MWKEEISDFKTHIEEVTGQKLSLEEIKEGTRIVNEKRKALQRLDALRGMHPDVVPISGKDGLFVVQVGFMDDPVRYTQKVNELCATGGFTGPGELGVVGNGVDGR